MNSKPGTWHDGWWSEARHTPSPNHRPRPTDATVDLAILHSISLPPGEYGGDAVERLFTNTLDFDAHPYYDQLRDLKVSAHFLVRRDGTVLQFVSIHDRAAHAGVSTWEGREGCNDFSVGIELEGLEGLPFEPAQYDTLRVLLPALRTQLPLRQVVGHEHVAPGRKRDPGEAFDWPALASSLAWGRGAVPPADPHGA